jgi:RHS repeat-associated protein
VAGDILVASTAVSVIFDRLGHLLAEANGATGAALREYIWLDDLPVAMVDDTGASPVIYYIHTDNLGTPRKLTDSAMNIVWDGQFDPFGNASSITGSATMNLRFPGQYFDAETGIAQNWNRDYDPTIGRYIESDPIGFWDELNSYGYVSNNPLIGMDPTGRYKVYGNWCGPNWTGGYSKSWDELSARERRNAARPIDFLDSQCMRHDKCYARCRTENPCQPEERSPCFRLCDYALENAAYATSGFWGDLIGLAIGRPGKREPGPNARKCCSAGGQ